MWCLSPKANRYTTTIDVNGCSEAGLRQRLCGHALVRGHIGIRRASRVPDHPNDGIAGGRHADDETGAVGHSDVTHGVGRGPLALEGKRHHALQRREPDVTRVAAPRWRAPADHIAGRIDVARPAIRST